MSVPAGDLRNSSHEEFFKNMHEALGPSGLLTYRYLGRRSSDMHKLDYDGLAIRHDMRNAAGGIKACAIAIGSAEAGGWTDFDAVPAPIRHSVTFLDNGRGVKELRMDRGVFRQGASIGFTGSTIYDRDDPSRVIAITRGIGIKLGAAPETGEGADTPITFEGEVQDSPDLPPLHLVFGGYQTPEGKWALPPLDPNSRSTSGTLHLGPTHIIFEAAAEELAFKAAGTDQLQVEQWDVMFTSSGRNGPFVVTGEAMTGNLGKTVVTMALHDEGNGDRLVATATAIYRPAD